MQSWMIGMVLGIVPVALWPLLPQWPVGLLLAVGAALLFSLRSGPARLISGVALGSALAIVHGNTLLKHRLPEDCVKEPLMLLGEVASLPRSSLMPDGTRRQRFELLVQTVQPSRCSGPRRVLLSYYGTQRIIPGQRWQLGVALSLKFL